MSEVTSVNGQTGVVVLAAANVGAVSASEAGQPSGVATLNGSGELPEAQLPSSVETDTTAAAKWAPAAVAPKLVEAGEVEGNYTPNLANGNVFEITAKANVTVKLPTNTPATVTYAELILAQNSSGGHTFNLEAFALLGEEPILNKAANAVNIVDVFTLNGGASWYLVGLQAAKEGAKGTTGATGPEGPEGVVPRALNIPSKVKIFKGTSSAETEERAGAAESMERFYAGNSLLLTTGTPVAARIIVPAKKVLHGLAFYTSAVEETAANRTHLWVALLNEKLEMVAHSLDYTSAEKAPMVATKLRGFLFTATYETAKLEALYGVVCEVMSSSKPISIGTKEGSALDEEPPIIGGTLNTGQTTPEGLPSPATLTAVLQAPYMVAVV